MCKKIKFKSTLSRAEVGARAVAEVSQESSVRCRGEICAPVDTSRHCCCCSAGGRGRKKRPLAVGIIDRNRTTRRRRAHVYTLLHNAPPVGITLTQRPPASATTRAIAPLTGRWEHRARRGFVSRACRKRSISTVSSTESQPRFPCAVRTAP